MIGSGRLWFRHPKNCMNGCKYIHGSPWVCNHPDTIGQDGDGVGLTEEEKYRVKRLEYASFVPKDAANPLVSGAMSQLERAIESLEGSLKWINRSCPHTDRNSCPGNTMCEIRISECHMNRISENYEEIKAYFEKVKKNEQERGK